MPANTFNPHGCLFFLPSQFFTHPVVDAEMNRKWYGRKFKKQYKTCSEAVHFRKLFSICCIFDLLFSPILFAFFTLIKKHDCNEKHRIRKGKQIINK